MNVISATPITQIEAGVDVVRLDNEQAGDQRQRAAEPAVAEVVWEENEV